MVIKNIIWIDEEIGEADVIVTDGQYDIRCFAHPLFQQIGEELRGEISIFDYSDVIRSDTNFPISKYMGWGKHFLIGRLVDRTKGIVQIGDILLREVAPIPTDIQVGDYIEFSAERVDIL